MNKKKLKKYLLLSFLFYLSLLLIFFILTFKSECNILMSSSCNNLDLIYLVLITPIAIVLLLVQWIVVDILGFTSLQIFY